MGREDTSGFKGWWPVQSFTGKGPDGHMQGQEAFRNVVDGQLVMPEKGWDGEPPGPTGDLANVRHVSDAYRQNYDRIFGGPDALRE